MLSTSKASLNPIASLLYHLLYLSLIIQFLQDFSSSNSVSLSLSPSATSSLSVLAEALSSTGSRTTRMRDCQNWLVVDFDGTCSIDDTTPMLPRLAALCAQELLLLQTNDDHPNTPASNGIMTYEERQAKFTELEQEYFALYKKAKSECPPPPADNYGSSNMSKRRKVISSLADALDRMDQVSSHVTDKVSTSGVLSELQSDLEHTDFVSRIVQKYDEMKVGIRPHCGSILKQVMMQLDTNIWGLAILSINWCPSLISASLQPHLDDSQSDNIMPIIWSNRVDSKTGNVELPIPGAVAKQEKIASLRTESTSDGIIVYIGDSSTDLLAILEADVGILFGGSSSTIALAEQYGVAIKPLSERTSMANANNPDEPIIWTTDCWSEIESQMKGTDPTTWFR